MIVVTLALQAATLGATNYAADAPMTAPATAPSFADEFDGKKVDTAKWRYDTSFNAKGWFNNELQYYAADRRENVRVEGGRLVIEVRKERLADKPDFGGQDYASGKLVTQGIAEWTGGFFEIRAKLPCGRGVWPAIWMLGSAAGTPWPAIGEIDIMEHVGWDEGRVHGTIHTKAYNHAIGTQRGANRLLPDVCSAFHTYQLDWNQDRLLIGIDGRAHMRFDNDGKNDPVTWPFAKAQYLILNVAVGGWGGQKGIDPAAFPGKMEVDYVRVWQKR